MNIKKEKGITLIALIITIVVLLILAVVVINAVNDGNLFAHSNNAVTKYQEEAGKENTIISSMLSKIPGANQNENIESEQVSELNVGDIVSYNSENWIVLYNDDTYGLQIFPLQGKLYGADSTTEVTLSGKEGYNACLETLNNACQKYINASAGAIAARCGGSTPDFVAASDDIYTDPNGIANGYKVATSVSENADFAVFQSLMMAGKPISFAAGSSTMIVAVREINYAYNSSSQYIYNFFINKITPPNAPENLFFDRIALGMTGEGTIEVLSVSSNYTYFPIVKLRTNGLTILSGSGTDVDPYIYTYE